MGLQVKESQGKGTSVIRTSMGVMVGAISCNASRSSLTLGCLCGRNGAGTHDNTTACHSSSCCDSSSTSTCDRVLYPCHHDASWENEVVLG